MPFCSHCEPCSERRKHLYKQDPQTCKCSCKFTDSRCKSRQLELNERTCRFVSWTMKEGEKHTCIHMCNTHTHAYPHTYNEKEGLLLACFWCWCPVISHFLRFTVGKESVERGSDICLAVWASCILLGFIWKDGRLGCSTCWTCSLENKVSCSVWKEERPKAFYAMASGIQEAVEQWCHKSFFTPQSRLSSLDYLSAWDTSGCTSWWIRLFSYICFQDVREAHVHDRMIQSCQNLVCHERRLPDWAIRFRHVFVT